MCEICTFIDFEQADIDVAVHGGKCWIITLNLELQCVFASLQMDVCPVPELVAVNPCSVIHVTEDDTAASLKCEL